MKLLLKELVQHALDEDSANQDVTTIALQLGARQGRAKVVAKEDLVLAGCDIFEEVFQALSNEFQLKWHFHEGDVVLKGQNVVTLKGPLSALLTGERVALNFLGRLSGIATLTKVFVRQIEHTSCKLLDTRKTTPLLRRLEKQAVRAGGGTNHRMGLGDAVLIKENHIQAAGGLRQAIELVQKNSQLPLEVEVSTLEDVKTAVQMGAQRLLLDNMSTSEMAEALRVIPGNVATEASGNMTVDRVREVAELGVNFISVGAITHSAPCSDLSMLLIET